MHYQCEIVMPPTEDVESAVASAMRQFDENGPDDEEHDTRHTFWDFYTIGGRFAGAKAMAGLDQEKVQEFRNWLVSENVTVSGLQFGKQELKPASQVAKVDAQWNEMFPPESGDPVACPIFKHSNDQYGRNGSGTIGGDVCRLGDATRVECSRVIIAGPSYVPDTSEHTGPLEAVFMLCDSQWNGVNHMDVKWDRKLTSALEQHKAKLENYRSSYAALITPVDDWLAITVDYHS